MTTYIKLSTKEYPRYIGDIMLDGIGPTDFATVMPTERPDYNIETHKCYEDAPTLQDEIWVQTWRIDEISDQEREAHQQLINIQQQRENLRKQKEEEMLQRAEEFRSQETEANPPPTKDINLEPIEIIYVTRPS